MPRGYWSKRGRLDAIPQGDVVPLRVSGPDADGTPYVDASNVLPADDLLAGQAFVQQQ